MSNGSVNKVILVGNLGSDPMVQEIAADSYIVKVNLATTFFWKDKLSKENKSKTEWHRIVFYGRLADVAKKYLCKGMKIYIEGSLTTSVWEDRNGVKRTNTEISATSLQMLTPRSSFNTPSDDKNTGPRVEKDYEDLPF